MCDGKNQFSFMRFSGPNMRINSVAFAKCAEDAFDAANPSAKLLFIHSAPSTRVFCCWTTMIPTDLANFQGNANYFAQRISHQKRRKQKYPKRSKRRKKKSKKSRWKNQRKEDVGDHQKKRSRTQALGKKEGLLKVLCKRLQHQAQ